MPIRPHGMQHTIAHLACHVFKRSHALQAAGPSPCAGRGSHRQPAHNAIEESRKGRGRAHSQIGEISWSLTQFKRSQMHDLCSRDLSVSVESKRSPRFGGIPRDLHYTDCVPEISWNAPKPWRSLGFSRNQEISGTHIAYQRSLEVPPPTLPSPTPPPPPMARDLSDSAETKRS